MLRKELSEIIKTKGSRYPGRVGVKRDPSPHPPANPEAGSNENAETLSKSPNQKQVMKPQSVIRQGVTMPVLRAHKTLQMTN